MDRPAHWYSTTIIDETPLKIYLLFVGTTSGFCHFSCFKSKHFLYLRDRTGPTQYVQKSNAHADLVKVGKYWSSPIAAQSLLGWNKPMHTNFYTLMTDLVIFILKIKTFLSKDFLEIRVCICFYKSSATAGWSLPQEWRKLMASLLTIPIFPLPALPPRQL